MNETQRQAVIDALVEFVLYVTKMKTTSEKAIEVLPEVVFELRKLSRGE